jgi:FtsX-like permease family protein
MMSVWQDVRSRIHPHRDADPGSRDRRQPSFRDRRISMGTNAIGRLKAGVGIEQARADMDRVAQGLAAAYPEADKGTGIALVPLKDDVVGNVKGLLLVLQGAVGFVLLIACVNVANLLLARSTGRAREFAIRRALLAMFLLGVFSALALVLSSVGIYAVISCLTGQRTHEIGVRVALGASGMDILGIVLGQGLKITLMGVAVGLAGALGLTRLITSLIYGVRATDPLTFGAVAVLLSGVALFACYIPARRAKRVDPIAALRQE